MQGSSGKIQACGECPGNAGVLVMLSWEPQEKCISCKILLDGDVFTCSLNCTLEAKRSRFRGHEPLGLSCLSFINPSAPEAPQAEKGAPA